MLSWVPLAIAGCIVLTVAALIMIATPRQEDTALANAIAILRQTRGRGRWTARLGRLVSDRVVAATMYSLGLGAAVLFLLETTWAVPAEYSHLRVAGIATTAVVSSCNADGVHTSCVVMFRFRGSTEQQTLLDFDTELPSGTPIPVLFDPADPSQVYAARDVADNKDADSPLLILGSIVIAGVAVLSVRGTTHQPWLWPLRRTAK